MTNDSAKREMTSGSRRTDDSVAPNNCKAENTIQRKLTLFRQ